MLPATVLALLLLLFLPVLLLDLLADLQHTHV